MNRWTHPTLTRRAASYRGKTDRAKPALIACQRKVIKLPNNWNIETDLPVARQFCPHDRSTPVVRCEVLERKEQRTVRSRVRAGVGSRKIRR